MSYLILSKGNRLEKQLSMQYSSIYLFLPLLLFIYSKEMPSNILENINDALMLPVDQTYFLFHGLVDFLPLLDPLLAL